MKLEPIIGLEIHVQMKTNSKMFSNAPVSFGKAPNTCMSLNDMAFPGTMSTVNKQAVINGIRMCNALHMEIDDLLVFDRKNYYYDDLPKGYQITQQYRPIGKNGYLTIKSNGEEKKIRIQRLHLEEDACKQIHYSDYSLLDFNRNGIPLMEIVSEPDFKNGDEASLYVKEIRSIVSYLGVSTGKMEEGSLRVDLNVSIKQSDKAGFGTKVEVKNLNSIANIQKAIDYEIKRQSDLIESGKPVKQETRRFNESTKKTELMRVKEDSVDYKYFPDPDIAPIRLSKEFIESSICSSPELATDKANRYMSLGLNEYNSLLITEDKDISLYFDELIKTDCSITLLANWLNGEVTSYLNKNQISINEFPITPIELGRLVKYTESGTISNKQAREVFYEMINSNKTAEEIINNKGLSQENDENVILLKIGEVIDNNPQIINDFKQGKDKVIGYIVGQVMKATLGKANPTLTNKLTIEELKRR